MAKFTDKRHWNDWSKFIEDVQAPGANNAHKSSTADNRGDSWDMSAGWEGACDMGLRGWPDGRARFIDGIQFAPHITELGAAPARSYGVTGSRPSIGRVTAGSPACMVKRGAVITGGRPIVRLLVSTTASASVEASTIENRGIAIASCIDQLESLGYQFEVIAFDGGSSGGKRCEYSVTIKHAGESLDVDRLAFALAHPAYLRRFGFRLREQCADLWPEFSGGYGSILEATPEQGQIYFPSLHAREANRYLDREKAVSHVAKVISEGAGIEYDGKDWSETDGEDDE